MVKNVLSGMYLTNNHTDKPVLRIKLDSPPVRGRYVGVVLKNGCGLKISCAPFIIALL